MRTVLRRPAFRRLFTGLVASMTAESMLLLVMAVWVKSLTGSDSMAAAAIFAVVAPFILAPLVGLVVDRFRRRPFLIVANATSAAVLTPLLLVRDRSDVWIIFVVAVLYGLSYITIAAALQGLIKEVVPGGLLAEANGALQTVKHGLRLGGPLAGAGLYTWLGGPAVAVVAGTGFLLAAVAVATLRVVEERPQPAEQRWLTEAAAGMRHLTGEPALRRMVLGVALAATVFGFGEALFFAFVDRGLHRPPAFLGVLDSAMGVGGILGGVLAARFVRRLGEVGAAAVGVLVFAPALLTFAYPSLVLAFPAVVLLGFGLPLAIVGLHTLTQLRTPQRLLGRTTAALELLIAGPQTLAIGAGALIVGVADYRVLFGGMAVLMLAAGAYLWLGRSLSTPHDHRGLGATASTAELEAAGPPNL
jgi:Na+/melibiose symporter-like transporter